jgi:hypothetical protein
MRGVFDGKAEQRPLFISIRLLVKKRGYKSKADRHTNTLAGSVHATHFESSTRLISEIFWNI